MTTLYAILAVAIITAVLTITYLIGVADGKARERQRNADAVTLYIIRDIHRHQEQYDSGRHTITHADLAQMEQEAKNKNEV